MRTLAAILLCSTVAACGGDPDLASSDSNIVDGQSAGAYRFAALIDAKLDGGTGRCSGALIAPRVVLTAGHCVHGFGPFVVTLPYADGQRAPASRGETFDWETATHDPQPDQHDVGLVFLDTPIELDRYPTLARDGSAEGREVRYIGRVSQGEASATGLYVGDAVKARDGASVGWPFTFATSQYTEEGDSGGPVVLASDDDLIAGVDSGGNRELDIELFARVDLVSDWIAERIEASNNAP